MIKALQLLKPGSTYTDCFEFVHESIEGLEVGIKLSAHSMYHTSDTNLDRLVRCRMTEKAPHIVK